VCSSGISHDPIPRIRQVPTTTSKFAGRMFSGKCTTFRLTNKILSLIYTCETHRNPLGPSRQKLCTLYWKSVKIPKIEVINRRMQQSFLPDGNHLYRHLSHWRH